MSSRRARLELIGASKRYPGSVALQDVNLTLQPGEIHALVGLNGAGKTTIMRLLLAMTAPTEGTVMVGGRDITRLTAADWRSFGHLVDNPLAYPELTVEQNLCIAGRLAGLRKTSAEIAAGCLAEELGIVPWWGRRTRALSQGNLQRLGLAAALIGGPSVLVLDEPTSALDPAGVVLVREALRRRVREHEASILVSSHHLDEVARIADRISVINQGRVVGSLEPDAPEIERAFFSLVLADAEARS